MFKCRTQHLSNIKAKIKDFYTTFSPSKMWKVKRKLVSSPSYPIVVLLYLRYVPNIWRPPHVYSSTTIIMSPQREKIISITNYANTTEEQDSHDDDNPPEITHQRQEKREALELLANQDNVDANIEGFEAIQRHKEVQKQKIAPDFSTSEENRQSMRRTLPYEKQRRPRAKEGS